MVVLAYDGGDRCRDLVEGLARAGRTVIVVHNPKRPEHLIETDLGVQVLNQTHNRGYAAGMNVGISRAVQMGADLILLLTHEVQLDDDSVDSLLAAIQTTPDAAAVGPVLRSPNGTPYSAGIRRRGLARYEHVADAPKQSHGTFRQVACIDGSAMLWRRAALEQLGGFDERFFMYFEDIDLSCRATNGGFAIGVCDAASAVSEPGGAGRRSAHAYLRARNSLGAAKKRGTIALIAGAAELLRQLWVNTPKPGGRRFRDAQEWRAAIAFWRGTVRGAMAYASGEWGAPPANLLDRTDIGAVEQPPPTTGTSVGGTT